MSRERKENTMKDYVQTMGETIPYKGPVVLLCGLKKFEIRGIGNVCRIVCNRPNTCFKEKYIDKEN